MKSAQNDFFDTHSVLYPFPKLLIEEGFSKVFKLRDLKNKNYLDFLDLKKESKLLEVGCGDGVFLKRIVKTYKVKAWGIDISSNSIRRAKIDDEQKIKFRVADATKIPFPKNSFDNIICFDTLEHIKDQNKVIEEMIRVLKPGGKLLLFTINRNQKYTWNYWMDKIGIDIYRGYDHDPKLFLDSNNTVNLLNKSGMKILKVELYNGFFTLEADEVIMVSILVLSKMKIFAKLPETGVLARFIISVLNIKSRLLLPVLEKLDIPWIKNGKSNGFFIVAQKL
ncbi:MAG: Type 11 methyltransferase [Microgenomates group bacterium GW2011_GWC1_37_12b]|nr:MAG: Type 11 methyltransferase [Microgenomates group bacterium GW2011_GWC1_37_12b]